LSSKYFFYSPKGFYGAKNDLTVRLDPFLQDTVQFIISMV